MTKKILIEATTSVTCPDCGHEHALQDGITRQAIEHYEEQMEIMFDERSKALEEQLRKDADKAAAKSYERKIAELADKLEETEAAQKYQQAKLEKEKERAIKKAVEDITDETKQLKEELSEKEQKIERLREGELALRKKQKELEDKEKEMELELQRRLDKSVEEANKNASQQFSLKEAELKKKIEDAQKSNEELRRKLEQGSQQLQGEVLELELEEVLSHAFPFDNISPVPKGVTGADVIQEVRLSSGTACGSIVWETKRAQNWSSKWVPKLKDDQQRVNGDIAVLVSTAFPAGMSDSFIQYEGVWLVKPETVRSVADALRLVLTQAQRQKAMSTGISEKSEALYNYICSPQFAQHIRMIVETYDDMRAELEKEKKALQRTWAKREKQIDRLTGGMLSMCGELEGISATELPALESLSDLEQLGLNT